MKKQTAVEWLVEQMIYKLDIRIENTTDGCELFEQALAMEKENSEISFFAGYNYEGALPIDEHEEYYTKTYEK